MKFVALNIKTELKNQKIQLFFLPSAPPHKKKMRETVGLKNKTEVRKSYKFLLPAAHD